MCAKLENLSQLQVLNNDFTKAIFNLSYELCECVKSHMCALVTFLKCGENRQVFTHALTILQLALEFSYKIDW